MILVGFAKSATAKIHWGDNMPFFEYLSRYATPFHIFMRHVTGHQVPARRGHQTNHCILAASFAIGFVAVSPAVVTDTAWAQASTGGRTLEEITVTARRREESLQDTPVTVNVFTSDDIDARGILTLPELGRYAPNVVIDSSISSAGPSNNIAVFIRGIGQTDYVLSSDPGVATYVDGVYVSRSIGGVLDLINVESIEILKGPQGTLFGRNAVGGAINITSQKPHPHRCPSPAQVRPTTSR